MKKLLSILPVEKKVRGLVLLSMMVGMGLFEALGVVSVMPFLAVVGDPKIIDRNQFGILLKSFLSNQGLGGSDVFLTILGLTSFIMVVLTSIYRAVMQVMLNRFVESVRYYLSTSLVKRHVSSPYVFFTQRNSSQLMKTSLSEVDDLIQSVFKPVMIMFSQGIVLLVLFSVLLLANFKLALVVMFVFSLFYLSVYSKIRKHVKQKGSERLSANEKRFKFASEVYSGIKIVKIMGRESYYVENFDAQARSYAENHAYYQSVRMVPNYLIEGIIFGGIIALVLWFHSQETGGLGYLLPMIGLYALAAYRMRPAVQAIFQGVTALRFADATINNIFNEMIASTELDQKPTFSSAPFSFDKSIEFKSVYFRYPQRNHDVVSDFSFDIKKGSVVGFVGTTGSGKSTTVDILMGLLEPVQGSILIDGEALVGQQKVRQWQDRIAYVPQEIFLADVSILENICFGLDSKKIDREFLELCLETANLTSTIDELPEGLSTSVGEQGIRLSGGQRQRVAIARALYHRAELLVLDEATSSLDSGTEKKVIERISKQFPNITLVMIAHRLTTLERCNDVCWLENGQIVQRGTLRELRELGLERS